MPLRRYARKRFGRKRGAARQRYARYKGRKIFTRKRWDGQKPAMLRFYGQANRIRPLSVRGFNNLTGIGERKAMDGQIVYNQVEAADDAVAGLITMPAQGQTAETRIGNHIWDDRLQYSILFERDAYLGASYPGTAASIPEQCRVMLIRLNKSNNGLASPFIAPADVLDGSLITTCMAPLTSDFQKRRDHQILFDRVYDTRYKNAMFSGTNWTAGEIHFHDQGIINLSRNHYFDGDASITGMGNYYWVAWTGANGTAGVGVTITIKCRFWFRDT